MEKKKRREWIRSYVWSAPSLVLIGLMVVFPILYTFYISLTNMNVYHWFDFTLVGLDNYIRALFVFDSGFLSALLATVLWTVVSMVLQLVIAFLLANLLNIRKLRLRKLYKTVLMFPWAMPGYVGILLWKTGMFNTQFGLLNQWMNKLGLAAVRWLSSDVSAFLSCTVVNLWLALPFMIMIMDGALQSIDRSYYESAILDGCSYFGVFFKILLPLLKPAVVTSAILKGVSTYNEYYMANLYLQDKNKYQVVSTSLYVFSGPMGSQYNYICAGVIITIIPALIIFLLCQDQIYSGMAAGAVKE